MVLIKTHNWPVGPAGKPVFVGNPVGLGEPRERSSTAMLFRQNLPAGVLPPSIGWS